MSTELSRTPTTTNAGVLPPATTALASALPVASRRVCVEGWRGVNHSIAMVNQHQLLAMLDEPGVSVWHRDLPFFLRHWNAAQLPAGFGEHDRARLDAIVAPPEGQALDAVIRLTSPFITRFDPGQKTLSFVVTECGLVPECFDQPGFDKTAFTRDGNRIVTPSRWSRDRVAEWGFDAERIHVVPHGVKTDVFLPLQDSDRATARQMLGVQPDEVLLLNVGVATWNKGLDLLVLAFARIRQKYPHVRLLLKDHRQLYRFGVERTMAEVQKRHPGVITEGVLKGVHVISNSLDQAQMRALYASADAYVSPYRAEGFNLPVLEAMACGTPAIVTDGGATDDFCPPALSLRIAARDGRPEELPEALGRFRAPDPDALVALLEDVAEGRVPRGDAQRTVQRMALAARLSWPAVTRRLLELV